MSMPSVAMPRKLLYELVNAKEICEVNGRSGSQEKRVGARAGDRAGREGRGWLECGMITMTGNGWTQQSSCMGHNRLTPENPERVARRLDPEPNRLRRGDGPVLIVGLF